MIDKNELIDIVGLDVNNDLVANILNKLDVSKPVKDYDSKYVGSIKQTKDSCIEFLFDENLDDTFYLHSIRIHCENNHFILPFEINLNDSYSAIKQKIGKKADYHHEQNKYLKFWLLENTLKNKYFLIIDFNKNKIESFDIQRYNDKINYTMPINIE